MKKQNAILGFILLSQNLAHAQGAKVGVKAGALDGIMQASLPVQLLLLVMIGCSIISWSIIYSKWRQFKEIEANNFDFLEFFWKAGSLEEVNERLGNFPESSLAQLFKSGFSELQRMADASVSHSKPKESGPRLAGIDNLERAIRKASDFEISLAESRLGFLATTGSTAPFVGLLGTVIGIMTSFTNIASSGNASLAVVAPGISEALFSTAVGLFAAIPAVVCYNYFIARVRRLEVDMQSFGSDFLNIAKRNFFKEQ